MRRAILPVLVALIHGCAAKTVTFSSSDKATVSLVTTSDTESEGQVVGETPISIEVAKLEGKVVKIWGPEVLPQFWVVQSLPGGETKVQLKLEKRIQPEKPGAQTANAKYRLILKAYKALADQDWKLARDLASELGKLDDMVAAPHLITGIAYLREGAKADARSAFERARILDPEDTEIAKLIQVAQ